MSALESTLRAKPFAKKNVYKTFSESEHGWAGARGDVSIALFGLALISQERVGLMFGQLGGSRW
jgi:hypothetical protein